MKFPAFSEESYFVLLLSFVVAVLILAPYLIGTFLASLNGELLLGTPIVAPADYRSYLSWIGQASRGEFLFYNFSVSSAFSPSGSMFHPIFLSLGVISGWSQISPMMIYYISLSVVAGFLVFTMYRFFSLLANSIVLRKTSIILFVFASGIGSLVYAPPSFYNLPEFSMFVRMNQYLLGSIDTILTIALFLLAIESFPSPRVRDTLGIGVMLGMLFLIHPYVVPPVVLTLFLFLVFLSRKRHTPFPWFPAFFGMIPLLLSIIIHSYSLAADQSFALWFFGGMHTDAHDIFALLLGFGLLLPLALVGAFVVRKEHWNPPMLLLFIWSFSMLFFMIQPFFSEAGRRFGEQLFIPLVFFSAVFLSRTFFEKSGRWFSFMGLLIVLLLSWGNVSYFFANSSSLLFGGVLREYNLDRLSSRELGVIEKLKNVANKDDLVISGGGMGSIFPIFLNIRSVFGHPSLMADSEASAFLLFRSLSREVDVLSVWGKVFPGTRYLIIDDEFRSYGYSENIHTSAEKIYEKDGIMIFLKK